MSDRNFLRAFFLVLPLLSATAAARADFLVQYELAGKLGTEASDPATFVAPGLAGVDIARGSGLTPSAAGNAFSASGFNDLGPNDFFSLGFNVQAGRTATVSELVIATRSSATGPGSINVLYTKDGGPETLLTTLTQGDATFLNTDLTFAPITVLGSFRIVLRAANATAANGGAIGAAGTFRIGDYLPPGGGTFQPITLNGVVGTAVAVPEPSSLVLCGLALASGLGWARGLRRLTPRSGA